MRTDTAFEFGSAAVRFGSGVTREVGADLAELDVAAVLVVTDANLARLAPVQTVLESLVTHHLPFVLYDRVGIEPTDRAWRDAIDAAGRVRFDAVVAIGGGSTIDTAKAINLYTTYPPGDFHDYVNAPVGLALAVPGPLKPLLAIPTTAGTGSETTGVAIFDDTARHVKTGISSRRLKPTLAYLDPDNTRTLPPGVAASSGLDILCHALESYTALPFTARPHPDRPSLRPAYQGSNPISDVWSLQSLRMLAASFVRAVEDPSDDTARAH
jgi:hydroxyacid-oxoacid transhydrogenase